MNSSPWEIIFCRDLQEADGADVNAEFLVRCANVHWCDINDGQAGSFRCFVLDDGFAPFAGVLRATVFGNAICEAAVALSSDFDLIGALKENGLLQVASLLVHVGDAVLAVVGDVLRGFSGHETQEG